MPTLNLPYSLKEIADRGKAIYERDIRAKVEADHFGEVLVLDIETGDYEVDEDHLTAADRIRARRPEGVFYALRVGFPALDKIGGGWGTQYRS